jgi:hypothetical protein
MVKKSQAAIENLMTYGWALLATLIAIGALWYFGILDFNSFLPERCTLEPPLSCDDFVIGNDGAVIVMTNAGGRDLNIGSISLESDTLSGECTGSIGKNLENGNQHTFYVNDPAGCSFVETGKGKINYKLMVTYSNLDSGLQHTMEGSMLSKYNPGVSVGDFTEDEVYGSPEIAGYWKFDDLTKAEKDYSGKGNDGTFIGTEYDGTLNGDVAVVYGVYGNGLDFDGISDYLQFPVDIPLTSEVTFSAWVRADTIDGEARGIWSYDSATKDIFFMATLSGSENGNIQFTTYDGSYQRAYGDLTPGVWHHVAGVAKENQFIRIYIDGNLADEVPISSFEDISWSDRNEIGAYSSDPSRFFDGTIDEAHIYNRILSQSDIQELMSSPYPVPAPVASYSFESIESNNAIDTHQVTKGQDEGTLELDGNSWTSHGDTIKPQSFTVAAWIYPAEYTGNNMVIVSKGNPEIWDKGYLLRRDSSGGLNFMIGDGDWDWGQDKHIGGGNTPLNQWSHVAASYDDTTKLAKIFVNGNLAKENVLSVSGIQYDTRSFYIGHGAHTGVTQQWSGKIDNVLVYNRNLTDSEIAALANI